MARIPGGAWLATVAVQTSVPAVTSCSAAGSPLVTTSSGPRPVTLKAVYCQVPEHSGWVLGVTAAVALSTLLPRSSATTCSAVGRPAQSTAYAVGNPAVLGATAATGAELALTGLGGSAAGGVVGTACGPPDLPHPTSATPTSPPVYRMDTTRGMPASSL